MKTENLVIAGLAVAVFYAAMAYSKRQKTNYVYASQYGSVFAPLPHEVEQGGLTWL